MAIGAASTAALLAAEAMISGSASGVHAGVAIAATAVAALGSGLWAGSAGSGSVSGRVAERWLTAAALTTVGASFSAFRDVYEAVMPGVLWPVLALLIGVGLPLYAIGLLVPPLIHWGDEFIERDDFVGEMPWGAAGPAVIGAMVGALPTIFLVGLVVVPRWGVAAAYLLAAIILFLPLVLRDPAVAAANESVLYQGSSPYGNLRVTEVVYPGERQPERRLYVNDEQESGELVRSGAPTLAYVAAAERWLTATTGRGSSYLFLGGGACTLPRRIAERDPSARCTVVELDPQISAIARRFFGLRDSRSVDIRHGDARSYLDSPDHGQFDRIYVDVYGGTESLPFSLTTREAVVALRASLSGGGIVAINAIANLAEEEAVRFWSLIATLKSVFSSVAIFTHLGIDYPERQNVLVVATDDPGTDFGTAAGGFERWPENEWPGDHRAIIYHDLESDGRPDSAPATHPAEPGSSAL